MRQLFPGRCLVSVTSKGRSHANSASVAACGGSGVFGRAGHGGGPTAKRLVSRYTEWIHRKTGQVAARELYEHRPGPVAMKNLADDPSHAETVERLSELLDHGKGWRAVRERLE